jgi:hypothetical protein
MGCFSYPFQYTLPQSLPGKNQIKHLVTVNKLYGKLLLGVFSKEDKEFGEKWKGAIKYRVKAEVDIPGTKHDLQASYK